MTAEIVIMNREAVVLAADSAVSLQKLGLTKVSVAADKIFQMSMNNPVGIMTYQNALFMGLPWETVIKSYRANRGAKKFDSIEEYGIDFIEYLNNNKLEFDKQAEKRYVEAFAISVFKDIQKSIADVVKQWIEEMGELEKDVLRRIVKTVINEYYKQSREKGEVFIPVGLSRKVVKKYWSGIEKIVEFTFKESGIVRIFDLDILTKKVRRELQQSIINRFSKQISQNIYSGIVIAGFGEKEYTPRAKQIRIEGRIGGKLKYREVELRALKGHDDAHLGAFAQSDIARRFMRGVDDLYRVYEDEYIANLCSDYAEKVVKQIKKYSAKEKAVLKQELIKYGESLREEFNKKIDEFIQEQFVNPVLGTVAFLPKVELATLAEALVNLTSVKRKVSPEEETVAGPIDVAIISKHDGFIWAKRKHYFEAEFNPQFFVRYGKESGNE